MQMELSKYKTQLGEEGYAEIQAYVNTLIGQKEEARQESIVGRKSLKAEVETLRKVKATLFDKLGLDDDADLEALAIPTKESAVEASKQFETRIKRLEKELKESKDSLTQVDGKYRNTLTEAALQKAISKHEFVDTDLITEYVKARIKLEGDELVYVDGDKTLSIDEGVQLIASTKSHLLKAQGQGGSGYNPNATSGKTKSFAEMNLMEKTNLYRENPSLYEQAKNATHNANVVSMVKAA